MDSVKVVIICISVSQMITGTIGGDGETCTIDITAVDKVDVVVYLNGESNNDNTWIQEYCKGIVAEMPYSKYSPTIIKIGASIVCDEKNVCTCPTKESPESICTNTFQYVCVSEYIGGDLWVNFLCCCQRNGFGPCLGDYNLGDKVKDCLANKGAGGAQDLAVNRAKEVTDKGVDTTNNKEPYFFLNGIFNDCVNRNVYQYWLETICALLNPNISKNIAACKEPLASIGRG